ncbi:efflux RND transporter periplasmic adaptor subunit [Pseudomonas gingeri]|uniref:Efflux RND transporter periplasmic adaptor subunit n=1 Tax=Pseudomonas gingeri TaxID=117681 RepID=A0A7Y7X9C0_9PSED|nr:efflux RND transporter periplasmic adaptor subunit [Pseudomonas gingeri]NWA28621.1 efflux RND transporter periplasmic adaptor subunit [Pseudomonas gingeri]NWB95699.1 efflux RND transporter periplasmic adaptor subunit [Pseudomonas gingeri]
MHNDEITSPKSIRPRTLLALGVAGVCVALAAGAALRVQERDELQEQNQAAAVRTADIIQPSSTKSGTLVLPGRLEAWAVSPVYARTNGYLSRWYADIGQPVKAGQVLADIDTPDLDQQLIGSQAALATAEAELKLAQSTSQRWDKLLAGQAVSQQDADERRGRFAAQLAARNQAVADVNRLRALTAFKRVVAPFNGVVTSRTTDIGALIAAGGSGTAPLFTVSDATKLRLRVQIPQAYVQQIFNGQVAHFAVPDLPGKQFDAVIERSSEAVNSDSGSMMIQLTYNNQAAVLKPGAYAQVTFNLDDRSGTQAGIVRVPASSIMFRKEGTAVAVSDQDGLVRIQKISIVTDFGSELEVLGLGRQDWIIKAPTDEIQTGDHIKPRQAPAQGVKNA